MPITETRAVHPNRLCTLLDSPARQNGMDLWNAFHLVSASADAESLQLQLEYPEINARVLVSIAIDGARTDLDP